MSVLIDITNNTYIPDSKLATKKKRSLLGNCEAEASIKPDSKLVKKIRSIIFTTFIGILGTHPFLGVMKSPAKEMIHTYFGIAATCSTVRTISEKLERKLKSDLEIERPVEFLLDQLLTQKFFGKYLVYRGVDKSGFPKLAWSDTKKGFLGEGDILYPDVVLREEHCSKDLKKITSFHEINLLFLNFKSMVPNKFTTDGCDPRCLWITFVLQEILKVEGVSKVKVWAKDGATAFELSDAFKPERWTMHTAPVVSVGEEKYVLDMSLPYPMLLSEWLASLHPRADDLLVSYSDRWELPCLSTPGPVPYIETLDRVLQDMQALYLHEMVDGAKATVDWSHWAEGERGVAPIGDIVCLEPTECDVIVNASGKVKKMAWREDFIERDGCYYLNSRIADFFS